MNDPILLPDFTSDGESALAGFEGTVLWVYPDTARKATIGRGHLCTKDELATGRFTGGVQAERDSLGRWTITREQAMFIYHVDMAKAGAAVARHLKVAVTPEQGDVLRSFTFNEGEGSLASGTGLAGSTLLRRLNEGHPEDVPAELLRWNKRQGPEGHLVEDPGLTMRRHAEAAIWEHGYGHPLTANAVAVAASDAQQRRIDLVDLERQADDLARVQDRDTLPDGLDPVS